MTEDGPDKYVVQAAEEREIVANSPEDAARRAAMDMEAYDTREQAADHMQEVAVRDKESGETATYRVGVWRDDSEHYDGPPDWMPDLISETEPDRYKRVLLDEDG